MGFQEAKEQISDIIRWNPNPKNSEDKSIYIGNVLTGYYLSKKENIGQNNSNIYEFEVIDPAERAGSQVSIWGSQLLDGRFKDIPLGCMVRVTFLGNRQPSTPKGRAYQDFKVEFDVDARRPMREAGAPKVVGNVPHAQSAQMYSQPQSESPVVGDGF